MMTTVASLITVKTYQLIIEINSEEAIAFRKFLQGKTSHDYDVPTREVTSAIFEALQKEGV